MGLKRIKISELTLSDNLKGLYTIGVKLINGVQTSVKVSLEHIQTAYENTVAATKKAETAANSANTAAGSANSAASSANSAATKANTAAGNADKATAAANTATTTANNAETKANTAASNADKAREDLEEIKEAAVTATNSANSAAFLQTMPQRKLIRRRGTLTRKLTGQRNRLTTRPKWETMGIGGNGMKHRKSMSIQVCSQKAACCTRHSA